MEFDTIDVKEELRQGLKRELQGKGIVMKVMKSDPAMPAEIPCIGINRVEDSETDPALSDFGDSEYDEETGVYRDIYTPYFQEVMEIRIWHTNADEREKVYQIVKAALIAMRPSLIQKGLVSCLIESGRDEFAPTGEYAPFPIYWSSCLFSYKLPLQVDVGQTVEPITEVTAFQAEAKLGGNINE